MAVPKKRTSSSRRNMRRSHLALKGINIAIDSETGEYRLSHHIDLKSGRYKKRQVFLPKHMKAVDTSEE